MNITEKMVCPKTVGQIHKAQAKYTVFKSRWYTVDTTKFKKSHRDEYILVLNDNWSRAWTMLTSPEETRNTEADYVEYSKNRKYIRKTETLEPGELCNYSSIYKGYLDVVSEGVAEIEQSMDDRVEVIHLRPLTGSLPELNIVQKKPGEVEYLISQDYNVKFSLHRHNWEDKTHYDLRVYMGSNIDEWAMPVDLHSPVPDPVVAIRKNCDDHTWMTFEGEKTINGKLTASHLLDVGMVDINQLSNDSISMSLHGETVNGDYVFTKNGELWTVSGGVSS